MWWHGSHRGAAGPHFTDGQTEAQSASCLLALGAGARSLSGTGVDVSPRGHTQEPCVPLSAVVFFQGSNWSAKPLARGGPVGPGVRSSAQSTRSVRAEPHMTGSLERLEPSLAPRAGDTHVGGTDTPTRTEGAGWGVTFPPSSERRKGGPRMSRSEVPTDTDGITRAAWRPGQFWACPSRHLQPDPGCSATAASVPMIDLVFTCHRCVPNFQVLSERSLPREGLVGDGARCAFHSFQAVTGVSQAFWKESVYL